MNVELVSTRSFDKKPLIPWEFRMYSKPKRVEHFATKTQMVSLDTTESYHRWNEVMKATYRCSLKRFFGKNYDAKTGFDPDYIYLKNNQRPHIYV
mmetsp:Transcript_70329/g.111829  ORF Transcript_70329/g.111829 Transcript_70329/m.111829 type:complete len:95 (-) Transcript_70329:1-285(-)